MHENMHKVMAFFGNQCQVIIADLCASNWHVNTNLLP